MCVKVTQLLRDRIGFDGIMSPQRRVWTTDDQKFMDAFCFKGRFKIATNFAGYFGCIFGSQRSRIGQHKHDRRLVGKPNPQGFYIPFCQ